MSRLRTLLIAAAGPVMLASRAAFGFDLIGVVCLTPGVLPTAAALVPGA
ncbi:MAG TPA: hypothetical protein VFP15_03150 [Gemmatimonadaceae bacterium]|nr:hypothetical protein [Gemmatimonadaceae bacterium]